MRVRRASAMPLYAPHAVVRGVTLVPVPSIEVLR